MTVFLTVYQFALDLYRHMALTAIHVKEAKPSDKDQKLSDGEGMYLLIKKMVVNTGLWTTDSPVSVRHLLLVYALNYR
jgi:hypothetical protein